MTFFLLAARLAAAQVYGAATKLVSCPVFDLAAVNAKEGTSLAFHLLETPYRFQSSGGTLKFPEKSYPGKDSTSSQ